MWKYIDRYNKWYDTVKEPWRSLLLIVKVGIPAILISTHRPAPTDPWLWYNWIGLVLIAVLCVVAVRRIINR